VEAERYISQARHFACTAMSPALIYKI